MIDDTMKSDQQLIEEYAAIVIRTQQPDDDRRLREIGDELLRRTAGKHAAAKRGFRTSL